MDAGLIDGANHLGRPADREFRVGQCFHSLPAQQSQLAGRLDLTRVKCAALN
jgi:hypothetical protein